MTGHRPTPTFVAALFALFACAGPASAMAWLGVSTQQQSVTTASPPAPGVRVVGVVPGSPAARAGLVVGDQLLELDGKPIRSAAELTQLVRAGAEDRQVSIRLVHAGHELVVPVTLGSYQVPPVPSDTLARGRTVAREHVDSTRVEGAAPDLRGSSDAQVRAVLDSLHARSQDVLCDELRVRYSARLRLGVRCEPARADSASNAPGAGGALVVAVVPGTPAARVGLRGGDVVVAANDHGIADPAGLDAALAAIDGKAKLAIVRHGKRQVVEVDLGALPEARKRVLDAAKPQPKDATPQRRDSSGAGAAGHPGK